MENYIYNPINNKTPKGACVENTNVTYTLKVRKNVTIEECYFVMHKDGEGDNYYPMHRAYMDEKYVYFEYSHMYSIAGFYWYHFEIKTNDDYIRLIRSDNLDVKISNADSNYLQSVIIKESSIDPAFRKGIIYHIFVDRFNKSGDVKARKGLNLIKDWKKPIELEYDDRGERVNLNCYGGNFQGIIDKLSYLKKLNVGTIYLSPVFEANSNHKYDIADYSKVDSMFGSQEDFENLIKKAKRVGIKVIIDGVFNHTGSDSVYFNKNGRYKNVGAYQDVNSPYYSWYDFNHFPNDYSCWWGIKTLPQTREDSGFFDYIAGEKGIVEKYMSMGLGGFRLDVVDELTNNFLHAICSRAKKVNPKAFMVGEVWEDASSKISYDERKEYFLGGSLDSVTNYPIKNAILDYVKCGNLEGLVSTINLIKDQYPKSVQNNLMNIIDTHDTMRAITYLGIDENSFIENMKDYKLDEEEKARAIDLLKMATVIQYTVMGIPTVFYGDEVGIEGMADPYCRKTFPWGEEDLTILEWYQKLGNLRNNKVFEDGELNIKYAENQVVVYERVKDNKKVIVAINKGNDDFEFILDKTMNNYFTGEFISGKQILGKDQFIVLVS